MNALIIGVTILAMSGACSQHEPGPYEGGGRSTTTPQLPSSNDAGELPDLFVQDNFVPKDTSTQDTFQPNG